MPTRAEAIADILLSLRRMLVSSVLTNDAIARRAGLNVVDGQALHLLALNTEPMTPGELSTASGLPTSTVTRVLDRLETAGFVRRAADPHDRRKVVIELDADRVADLSREYDPVTAQMAGVFAAFSVAELQTIGRFLDLAGATGGPGSVDAARR